MKKYYFLIIVALILGLVLTGCSLLSDISQVPATNQSGIINLTKGTPGTITLYAGQDIDVGTVTVLNDDTYLYVTYETTGGWAMTETHLAVATSLGEIPQTKKGNPIPGKFEHSMDHDPAVTVYIYTIPLAGLSIELCIAAHAVVVQYECYETVWQIGEVETYDCEGDLTNYANEFNWRKSDDGGITYDVLVDDCEIGPNLGDNQPSFAKPFIVETNLDNEFPYNSNATNGYAKNFEVKWTGKLPFGGKLVLSWSPGREGSPQEQKSITIDSLPTFTVGDFPVVVEANDGFMGEYFLVENEIEFGELLGNEHTINFVQTIGNGTFWDWIRLDKVCEESAWADGPDFDGKNWATYFNYTVEVRYSFTDIQDVNDGTVGQLVTTVEEDGEWMVWTFDFPVEQFTGDGNLNVGLIIATDGEGNGPAYQIHNNDGATAAYPHGMWLYSPWGPTIFDGWNGWHSGDTNTLVTDLDWVEAKGQRNTPWEGFVSGDGVMEIRIKKSVLGESFHWAANPTVGTGFWGPASDITMQIPTNFNWETPLVTMSIPNYIAR